MSAIDKLQEQRGKFKLGDPEYAVASQLMDICRREAHSAELVEKDLDAGMDIAKAAGEIKKYADANRGGASVYCVTPDRTEEILRGFYGLPARGAAQDESGVALDLTALLG